MGYINVNWDPTIAVDFPKAGEVPKYNNEGMLSSSDPDIYDVSNKVSTTRWIINKLRNNGILDSEESREDSRIAKLEQMINFLLIDGGVQFKVDDNGVLDARVAPHIEYIASQINAHALDYDAVIEKYPEIEDELNKLLTDPHQ